MSPFKYLFILAMLPCLFGHKFPTIRDMVTYLLTHLPNYPPKTDHPYFNIFPTYLNSVKNNETFSFSSTCF